MSNVIKGGRGVIAPPPLLGLRVSRYLNYKQAVLTLVTMIYLLLIENYKLCHISERSILAISKSHVNEAVDIDHCLYL